jgi:hypothetical protein
VGITVNLSECENAAKKGAYIYYEYVAKEDGGNP